MSVQSEMPCWEIIKCKKKETCLFAENGKKSCWEMVGNDDACSFHVCIDCLVYLAKHKDSTLTKETFCYILEKRKNIHITSRITVHRRPPSRALINSANPAKNTFKNNPSLSA